MEWSVILIGVFPKWFRYISMKAIILAGGFGTRLKDLVSDRPKPMADINGRPFLEILINKLISNGITSIVLSLHYLPEKIIEYFSKAQFSHFNIDFLIEDKPLGTGGAIRYAITQGGYTDDENILVLNGDTFVEFNHKDFIQNHIDNNALLSILLRKVNDTERYGKVLTEGNKIISFSALGDKKPGLINAGVYIINRQIFNHYDFPIEFSFEHDFLEREIKNLKPSFYKAGNYFIDIGIPEDYIAAQKELLNHE